MVFRSDERFEKCPGPSGKALKKGNLVQGKFRSAQSEIGRSIHHTHKGEKNQRPNIGAAIPEDPLTALQASDRLRSQLRSPGRSTWTEAARPYPCGRFS